MCGLIYKYSPNTCTLFTSVFIHNLRSSKIGPCVEL